MRLQHPVIRRAKQPPIAKYNLSNLFVFCLGLILGTNRENFSRFKLQIDKL
jgi:hypothetical protein